MTLKEILERKKEIKEELSKRGNEMSLEELDKLDSELTQLDDEEVLIRKRQDLDRRMKAGAYSESDIVEVENKDETKISETLSKAQQRAARGDIYKKRNKQFVSIQERAVGEVEGTSKNGVLSPKYTSDTIEPYPFNEVSSILDLVDVINLPNGTEYTQAFEVSTGEGDYTLEPTTVRPEESKDGVYNKVSLGFAAVTIKRNKITALDFISEELQDIPSADYAARIEANVALSLRKKIAKEIILGDGSNAHFVGILSNSANAVTVTDTEIGTIDENTVDNVSIDFGGYEDIESTAAFLLNKKSLKAFKAVRGSDKRPIYSVVLGANGRTATIDGARVIFTSHIKPIQDAEAGEYWGVYGDFKKYKLLDFGGAAVQTSEEFKFDQGVTTIRGRIYSGGAPAGYKAFTRLKKPTE